MKRRIELFYGEKWFLTLCTECHSGFSDVGA